MLGAGTRDGTNYAICHGKCCQGGAFWRDQYFEAQNCNKIGSWRKVKDFEKDTNFDMSDIFWSRDLLTQGALFLLGGVLGGPRRCTEPKSFSLLNCSARLCHADVHNPNAAWPYLPHLFFTTLDDLKLLKPEALFMAVWCISGDDVGLLHAGALPLEGKLPSAAEHPDEARMSWVDKAGFGEQLLQARRLESTLGFDYLTYAWPGVEIFMLEKWSKDRMLRYLAPARLPGGFSLASLADTLQHNLHEHS